MLSSSDLTVIRGLLGIRGWVVGKEIDKGKFGTVYSVFRRPPRSTAKKYVLKLIPECTPRIFENEVETQKLFAKRGIGVHIYYFDLLVSATKHRVCGIIMERMDGTLNDLAKAGVRLQAVQPIVHFIRKFARFACDHKYAHADVHGGNIAYRRVSRSKFEYRLLDFGYSRRLKSCRKIANDVDDLYHSFLRLLKNTHQRTTLRNEVDKIKTYLSLNY